MARSRKSLGLAAPAGASKGALRFASARQYINLRELLQWLLYEGWDRLSFTIAGRNLWRTTKFAGIDPEANYFGGATGIVSNFQTQPPPTYWTFRMNVAF